MSKTLRTDGDRRYCAWWHSFGQMERTRDMTHDLTDMDLEMDCDNHGQIADYMAYPIATLIVNARKQESAER